MNCKPGDLAIVVRSFRAEAIGRLVTVIERAPACDFRTPDGRLSQGSTNGWVVHFERPLSTTSHIGLPIVVSYGACRDAHLKPIRPQDDDARDETLDWLPVPTKETEAA